MPHLNVEIKARCPHPDHVRRVLQDRCATFIGQDHQIDTYFNVLQGRLKLRQGQIEYALIHYDRPNQAGPKSSAVTLYHPKPDPALLDVLTRALGVRVVVDKQREIYFLDHVKFHLDMVQGLGSFVEIEAIDTTGQIGYQTLLRQCREYMALFAIQEQDLIDLSYSDMLSESL